MSKVTAVTLGCWISKVLATTLGETGGDAARWRTGGTLVLARGPKLGADWTRMKPPYRPFRTPLARWLACVLVTLALLVNGMAVALAASPPMKGDCCAGMAAQHGGKMPCHESGNPCPPVGDGCDDHCLARCVVGAAVLSINASLPEFFQRHPAQLVLIARASSSLPPSPGLRPPISA